jgi:hypothetical protein
MKRLTLSSLALCLIPSLMAYEDSYKSIAEIIFDDCPACYNPGTPAYVTPENTTSDDKPEEPAEQLAAIEIPSETAQEETPGIIEEEEIQAQPLEENINGEVEL